MLDQALLLEKTSRVLTGTYDFQKLAQQAVDLLCKELKPHGLIGVGILRVQYQTNELYAYAYHAPFRKIIDNILPVPFSKLHLTLDAQDNLMIKTVHTNRSQESTKLHDFGIHALPEYITNKVQKLLKVKFIRSFPINSKSGKVMGVFYCVFPNKHVADNLQSPIQTFANQLGLAFSNVFAFERLMHAYKKNIAGESNTIAEDNTPSIKFTLRVTPNQFKKLEQISAKQKKKKADILRDLLDTTLQ